MGLTGVVLFAIFHSFLGMTPTPEHLRFGLGGDEKGPSIRPASHSLCNSIIIMSGCWCAEAKLGAVCGILGPVYLRGGLHRVGIVAAMMSRPSLGEFLGPSRIGSVMEGWELAGAQVLRQSLSQC